MYIHLTVCFADTPSTQPSLIELNFVEVAVSDKTTIRKKSLSVDSTWHLQLQGKLHTRHQVDVYDIDLFDTPAKTIELLKDLGKTVICYFSAGSFENWRVDADRYSNAAKGLPLDGWPGERWLDIRSAHLRNIIINRLNLAKRKGCSGVDPDNVDGYIHNTGFNLTAADQIAFNRFISTQAHDRHLLIGLKNDVDQIPVLVDEFDFTVNEQCHEFNECQKLMPFITNGKPVFNIEYKRQYVNTPGARNKLCVDAHSRNFQTLVLPLTLDDSFRISCRPDSQQKSSN